MELITIGTIGRRDNGEGGLDGFSFWLQASSSETTNGKESVTVSPAIDS